MVDIPTPEQVGGQLAGQVADSAQQAVTTAGRGLFSGLWNVITSPLSALGGMARGVLNFGTLTTGAIYTLIHAGIRFCLPDLYGATVGAVLGDEARQEAGVAGKSITDIVKESAVPGFGLAALINGAGGAINGVRENSAEANAGGSTVGGMVSGAVGIAAFAGIACVAIGAIRNYSDHGSLTPPPTPAGNGDAQGRGNN